jgi:hypothetical protein
MHTHIVTELQLLAGKTHEKTEQPLLFFFLGYFTGMPFDPPPS